MNRFTLALAICLFWDVQSAAANPGAPTFDEASLLRVQSRYPDTIVNYFFRDLILPQLNPPDAAALMDVEFVFPLRASKGEPVAFSAGGKTIQMSATSLLFHDELATAVAWLTVNGYDANSIMSYASMLKYGRLGANPPTPLQALCIPRDALDDFRVNQISNDNLNTFGVYILLHELGHVLYNHPGYSEIPSEVARMNEAQADYFATSVFASLGFPTTLLPFYLLVWAHLADNASDFATASEYEDYLAKRTHPLEADRIGALANSFAGVGLGGPEMLDVARALKQPEVQQTMALTGLTATIANLAPRRPGEMLGTPCGYVDTGLDFDGPYDGTWAIPRTSAFQGMELPMSLILFRNGSRVAGNASFNGITYTIEGETDGTHLYYSWFVGDTEGPLLEQFGLDVEGQGVLQLEPDGVLTGVWSGNESTGDGNVIRLTRRATQ